MTDVEIELSKKLLNAQSLAMQAADLALLYGEEIVALLERVDKLEAVVEGMAAGKRK